MTKQDNAILWIIGIIILFLVLTQTNLFKTQEEMIGLTPHYYRDGVEVFPTRGFFGFAIVNPPGEDFDKISFDISATNTGDFLIENMNIVDASPTAFTNALPTTSQSLAVDESKTLWTSGLMDTIDFVGISPVNFWVNISGTFLGMKGVSTIYEEGYSGDISFKIFPTISNVIITPSATPLITDTVIICADVVSDSSISIVRINLHCDTCYLGDVWNWGLVMDVDSVDENGHGRYCKELTPTSMKSTGGDLIRSYYVSVRDSENDYTKTETYYYTYYEPPFEGCTSTTYTGSGFNVPMAVYGHLYDGNNQPYPIGTQLSIVDSDCERRDIGGNTGYYSLTSIGAYDVVIEDNIPNLEDLYLFINDEYTGYSFKYDSWEVTEVNVGSCTIDCSGQQCGPNNCYNGVCGTCGFGYSCDSNVCNPEGAGGIDASQYCYAPINMYEEGYPLRSDWIERVQFANIDVTSGPDFDDGYEDLTNNIANVIGSTGEEASEYTITVTLGMVNDGERCAAVWFAWDNELYYGDRIGCCNYNGCTVSETWNLFTAGDIINLMRVKEAYGDFSSTDMHQPCENEGEVEDYSINVV